MGFFLRRKSRVAGRVLGLGNCQVQGMVRCAAAALGLESAYLRPPVAKSEPELFAEALADASVVFATRGILHSLVRQAVVDAGRSDLPVIAAPSMYFPGFHPDVVYPG